MNGQWKSGISGLHFGKTSQWLVTAESSMERSARIRWRILGEHALKEGCDEPTTVSPRGEGKKARRFPTKTNTRGHKIYRSPRTRSTTQISAPLCRRFHSVYPGPSGFIMTNACADCSRSDIAYRLSGCDDGDGQDMVGHSPGPSLMSAGLGVYWPRLRARQSPTLPGPHRRYVG